MGILAKSQMTWPNFWQLLIGNLLHRRRRSVFAELLLIILSLLRNPKREVGIMKFFIPGAVSSESEKNVYDVIKSHLGQNLGATFSDRHIRILQWRHEGKQYEAEVGKSTSFNSEAMYSL
jgi:hypothetical protein